MILHQVTGREMRAVFSEVLVLSVCFGIKLYPAATGRRSNLKIFHKQRTMAVSLRQRSNKGMFMISSEVRNTLV